MEEVDEWGDLKVEDKKDDVFAKPTKIVENDEDDWGDFETPV